MSKIKIALVDDHQIVLDGLSLLLGQHPDIDLLHQETNGLKLLDILQKNSVLDILLTDISMPIIDGLALSKQVAQLYPHIKIVALSLNDEGGLIDKLIDEASIKGFVLKTASKAQLYEAIETVMAGNTFFSREITDNLTNFRKNKLRTETLQLTQREKELIRHLATGLSNREIGELLFISEKTVATHRKNIFRKTNVNNLVKLLELARVHNII